MQLLAAEQERWRGGMVTMVKRGREPVLRRLRQMAEGKANDAVKLAYLTQEQLDEIDRLDLTALVEFKRSGNGAVEIKLVDRAAVLERLLELEESAASEQALRKLLGTEEEP